MNAGHTSAAETKQSHTPSRDAVTAMYSLVVCAGLTAVAFYIEGSALDNVDAVDTVSATWTDKVLN